MTKQGLVRSDGEVMVVISAGVSQSSRLYPLLLMTLDFLGSVWSNSLACFLEQLVCRLLDNSGFVACLVLHFVFLDSRKR